MCWPDAQAACHRTTTRARNEDYQNLGLMPKPLRAHGSVRRYGPDALRRLRFIKRAQALGFSLDEVRHLLELSIGGLGATPHEDQ